MPKSDQHLMATYQRGGSEGVKAFDELYRKYAPKLYGYLKAKLRNDAQADEVFQATMLRFHETRMRFDPKYPLAAWLFTLCRNVMHDHWRKMGRRGEVELPDELAVPEVEEVEVELPLAKLKEAQREALEMRFLKELEFREIAERLNVSEVNARQIVSRALRRLKTLVEGEKV